MTSLEVDMHADGLYQDGTAVLVVAGVGDVLCVEGVEDAAPGVEVVVALEDVLAGVVESAVAEQEAEAAEGEVALVVAFDGVGDEGEADFVVGTSKGATGAVAAERDGLVDLGVGEGLVLAFVPAEAAGEAEVGGEYLFGVEAEAVLHGSICFVGDDFGGGVLAGEKGVVGLAVEA